MDARQRFTAEDVETWRRDGIALLRDFFTADEVAAVQADFERKYGRKGGGSALDKKAPGEIGRIDLSQYTGVDAPPFDGLHALNLIGVHPALIAFAKTVLKTDDVRAYQINAWAKYTGEADYDQPFHTDFSNHTITVPSEDAARNSVPILCYFSDVTDAHGAFHYVTRPDSDRVAGPEAWLNKEPAHQAKLQSDLSQFGRSSASPAGTAIAYGLDVYHRGTNLTIPDGYRYAVMTCFKKGGDDAVGYYAWPYHHRQPWGQLFKHATPEQLACFGVQRPGDPFWTETTLARAAARYPDWDLSPYRAAMTSPVV